MKMFFFVKLQKKLKKPNDQFFTCPSFQFISFLKAFTEVKFKTLVLAQMLKKTHQINFNLKYKYKQPSVILDSVSQ